MNELKQSFGPLRNGELRLIFQATPKSRITLSGDITELREMLQLIGEKFNAKTTRRKTVSRLS